MHRAAAIVPQLRQSHTNAAELHWDRSIGNAQRTTSVCKCHVRHFCFADNDSHSPETVLTHMIVLFLTVPIGPRETVQTEKSRKKIMSDIRSF